MSKAFEVFWVHIIQIIITFFKCFGFIDLAWPAIFFPYYFLFLIKIVEGLLQKKNI